MKCQYTVCGDSCRISVILSGVLDLSKSGHCTVSVLPSADNVKQSLWLSMKG